MKNVLQTHSIAWAQGVRITLEAEGIRAVILDEHDRGGLGAAGRVRLAVLNDDDVAKAQAIVARLAPPKAGPPPPSWRWQKRGLLLLAADFVLFAVWVALLDGYRVEGATPGLLIYGLSAFVVILFIGGMLLIMLGPQADKQ